MNETIRDPRSTTPAHHVTTGPSTMRRNANKVLSPSLADLADRLRDNGHVVHARYANSLGRDSQQLVGAAQQFFERALALSRATETSHAYIRLYQSSQSLFLEVTQLTPRSFNAVAHSTDAQQTLEALDRWATANGHILSVRRGPRSQLRIAVMIGAPEASAFAQGLSAGRRQLG